MFQRTNKPLPGLTEDIREEVEEFGPTCFQSISIRGQRHLLIVSVHSASGNSTGPLVV